MTSVQDILDKIEEFAPLALKEDGDPTGFQLGNRQQQVKKIMTTLDVRPNVVQEAIDNNIDLIIAHHPVIFKPAQNLDYNDPQNQMYADLISHNISVHSAHTNVDKTKNGMNDWLAAALKLKATDSIIELDNLGIVGELEQELSLESFADKVKQAFNLPALRIIKPYKKHSVKKVAIIGGDGGKFYQVINKIKADTFITGDVYYHTAHDMQSSGLNVIDPGHHIEAIFMDKMASKLRTWSKECNWNVEVNIATANTEPYEFR